ncbi:MAG: 7-carboxy-7-deazaguanine synthase QueE [Candidatus Krumholzibacteriota bacterium]|nr:7-carboxy-7-deazaguanine synthase QueE [Candidatus Krumholzibacteriota bacterium]
MTTPATAYVAELFRSVQGEGPWVGALQVFLRLAGCRRRCPYCDTNRFRHRPDAAIIRGPRGEKRFPNPVAMQRVRLAVDELVAATPGLHSLSVTGGEPLEQPDFLVPFLEDFRETGVPVYLETNGLEEEAARCAAPLVDIVSLDIKLPGLSGEFGAFETYERVLPLFRGRGLFCKIVVTAGFDAAEFIEAVCLVARAGEEIPVIVQPASPPGTSPDAETLMRSVLAAGRYCRQVRLIPQCHKLLDLP